MRLPNVRETGSSSNKMQRVFLSYWRTTTSRSRMLIWNAKWKHSILTSIIIARSARWPTQRLRNYAGVSASTNRSRSCATHKRRTSRGNCSPSTSKCLRIRTYSMACWDWFTTFESRLAMWSLRFLSVPQIKHMSGRWVQPSSSQSTWRNSKSGTWGGSSSYSTCTRRWNNSSSSISPTMVKLVSPTKSRRSAWGLNQPMIHAISETTSTSGWSRMWP